jgi:hypothetical protein
LATPNAGDERPATANRGCKRARHTGLSDPHGHRASPLGRRIQEATRMVRTATGSTKDWSAKLDDATRHATGRAPVPRRSWHADKYIRNIRRECSADNGAAGEHILEPGAAVTRNFYQAMQNIGTALGNLIGSMQQKPPAQQQPLASAMLKPFSWGNWAQPLFQYSLGGSQPAGYFSSQFKPLSFGW